MQFLKKYYKLHVLLVCCLIIQFQLQAQQTAVDSALTDRVQVLEQAAADRKPGEDNFMVAGLMTFGFASHRTKAGGVTTKSNSIVDGDNFEFSPLLLWRHGKKFLLEFEPTFAGDQLGVNWADVSYFAAPGLIIRAGYLVLPFGSYSKRLAAGWINKFATDPEGVADFPPLSDYGVEVEGGFQAGTMKWNYDFAISNGMQLNEDGTIQNANLSPTNNNKNFTGRIGWLPLSNSSLEIGLSGMTGKLGDPKSHFSNARSDMFAADLNLVENIHIFQLNIKGQYNAIDIKQSNYINPSDSSSYSFSNHTATGYVMAALRPIQAPGNVLKNFEIAARYGNYTTPKNSLIGMKDNSWALGLNYWINWRTVVHLTYESVKSESTISENLGGTPGLITKENSVYLQFSIQL
ncbi:MAG: hypothetical protein M3015_02530 [Bacteroidota bacterium]|nr:hypothetical protein [Bacteroidota bacterium]